MRDFKINTDLKENFMQFSRESLGFFMEFNYEGQILAQIFLELNNNNKTIKFEL